MSIWIQDNDAERALDYLRDNAPTLGEAKKQAVLAERMVKRTLALEMARSEEKTAAGKERDALASQAYLDAIHAEADAAGQYEVQRALKDAAGAKLDAWRTLRASERAMSK
jgi:hypothetical protein